jgi:hypothetical protein
MKFNCGPSLAERAILHANSRTMRLQQWHPFFCLLPRRVGHQCVWLETIQRKGRQGYCGYTLEWYFEYRLYE